MLPVPLDCLSSPYVLCTQCCQFLWIVCLRTRHKAKTNNPEQLATLGTQDIRRRQTIQRNWQHWVHKTWQYLCVVFFVCLSLSWVWCTQCWQYLCVVFFVCLSLLYCPTISVILTFVRVVSLPLVWYFLSFLYFLYSKESKYHTNGRKNTGTKVNITLMVGKYRNKCNITLMVGMILTLVRVFSLPLVWYLLSFLYFPTISVIFPFVPVFPYQ
jgi:hypothetical protein